MRLFIKLCFGEFSQCFWLNVFIFPTEFIWCIFLENSCVSTFTILSYTYPIRGKTKIYSFDVYFDRYVSQGLFEFRFYTIYIYGWICTLRIRCWHKCIHENICCKWHTMCINKSIGYAVFSVVYAVECILKSMEKYTHSIFPRDEKFYITYIVSVLSSICTYITYVFVV